MITTYYIIHNLTRNSFIFEAGDRALWGYSLKDAQKYSSEEEAMKVIEKYKLKNITITKCYSNVPSKAEQIKTDLKELLRKHDVSIGIHYDASLEHIIDEAIVFIDNEDEHEGFLLELLLTDGLIDLSELG